MKEPLTQQKKKKNPGSNMILSVGKITTSTEIWQTAAKKKCDGLAYENEKQLIPLGVYRAHF